MNEAETLFCELLNCPRSSLYLERNRMLDPEVCARVSAVLKRRMKGEPLAYILAKQEFMGLEFTVTDAVLIPRQDTEIVVETVLSYARQLSLYGKRVSILDLGTGSGCIAVSLAKLSAYARVWALDISAQALAVARCNAQRHGVADRIVFVEACFSGCAVMTKADIIVSNPPYIRTGDLADLQAEVLREPRGALDGGADGLDFYRCLAARCAGSLKESGVLIMEIGYDQREEVKKIFQNSGKFEIIETIEDYGGNDRVMVAKKRLLNSN